MVPVLKEKTDAEDDLFEKLIPRISSFECSEFISKLIGKTQKEKKPIIHEFQEKLIEHLRQTIDGIDWKKEFIIPNAGNRRDRCDIYGAKNSTSIVIEMDAYRADQVSKKFVSRCALFERRELIYISLCYVGTDRMNQEECVKYFWYCANLATRLGCSYAGFITE